MRKEYWNGLTYPLGFDGLAYSYMTVARENGYAVSMMTLFYYDTFSQFPDPCCGQPWFR